MHTASLSSTECVPVQYNSCITTLEHADTRLRKQFSASNFLLQHTLVASGRMRAYGQLVETAGEL